MTLQEMKNVDVRTVDPATLVDIKKVTVNTSLPQDERLLDHLSQIGNPYCFLCGKTIVKIGFSETEMTMEDSLEGYLLSL